ncbi:MAG TPA: hypothetical protein VHE37_02110, partial [Nevskiaceae bacterium]|nr:hypothetical protein [Nevskiaceae bacterium]
FDPTPADYSRAVQVTLTRPMPDRLVPFTVANAADGPQTLSARAAAYATPSATVMMGTQTLALSPNAGVLNNLLSGLLGGPVSLNLLTYQALFSANVPVLSVLDNLDIQTPEQLESTTVGERDLLNALASALSQAGQAAAASAASTLAATASNTRTLPLMQALGVGDVTSDAMVNAGRTILGVSQAVLGGNLLNLSLSGGNVQLGITQAALPTLLLPGGIDLFPNNYASNTQLALLINALPLNIPLLGMNGNVSLFAQVGQGTAEVDHLVCARRGVPNDLAYVRARTSVVRLGIGKFDNINSPNPTPQAATILNTNGTINLAGIPLPVPVKINISAYFELPLDLGSGEQMLPAMKEGDTYHMGTPRVSQITGNLTPSINTVNVSIQTNGPLSGVLALLSGTINSLLATLQTTVQAALQSQLTSLLSSVADATLLPILDSAGVTIGGADVTVTNIDAPQPYLFTH